MIEPHSAHDGASAWVWKLTLVAPRLSVIAPPPLPPPLPWALPLPFAAWPLAAGAPTGLLAITASSSRGGASAAPPCAAVAEALSGTSPLAGEGVASEAVGGATASEASGCAPGLDVEPPDAEVALCPVESGVEMAGAANGVEASGASESIAADRSISPSVAFSSVDRNREPSHRKM